MKVLAIDTATEILSIAVGETGGENDWSHAIVSDCGLKHTGKLMSTVDILLEQTSTPFNELELIACSSGPGSFTGLRIGMATAKGLGEAVAAHRRLSVPPVVALPTLDVMALSLPPAGLVLAVIDGRKGRYYAALAYNGRMLAGPVDLPAVEAVDTLLGSAGPTEAVAPNYEELPVVVTGPHARRFTDEITSGDATKRPTILVVDPGCRRGWATELLRRAPLWLEQNGPDTRDAGPSYVRVSDAEIGITRS